MTQILICTHNQGKFLEISESLKDLPAEIVSLDDLGIDLDVEETEDTYEGNAVLKAKTYGEMSGLISIADDTGLEVDALGGNPGVHSKRYFKGSGEDRNQELNQLIGSSPNRNAQFVAAIAVYNPKNKEIKTFEGVAKGKILTVPVGEARKNLGYDSVFFSNDLGKTFAESSIEEKNQTSHRGRAVQASLTYLSTLL